MKRKVFGFILVICLVLAGCGEEKQTNKPQNNTPSFYMVTAQDHLDRGDVAAAIAVLEQGVAVNSDPQLQALLDQLTAAEPTVPVVTLAPVESAPTEQTEPETQAPVESVQLLNNENRRRVNIFLSNFAEQSMQSYPTGDYEKLDFGHIFCKINKNELLHYDGDIEYILKSDMDRILQDYLGTTVKPDEAGEVFQNTVTYQNGRYEWLAADGEMYDYIAIANGMEPYGSGSYRVSFDIYAAYEGVESGYYQLTAGDAAASSALEWCGHGWAVLRDHVRSNGTQSYLLLDYFAEH